MAKKIIIDQYVELHDAGARPLSYFSHDVSGWESPSRKQLIRKYGMAGYGRYMRLLEMLAVSDRHILHVEDDDTMLLITDVLRFEQEDECNHFIQDLIKFGLIQLTDGFIWDKGIHESGSVVAGKSRGGQKSRPNSKGSQTKDS